MKGSLTHGDFLDFAKTIISSVCCDFPVNYVQTDKVDMYRTME